MFKQNFNFDKISLKLQKKIIFRYFVELKQVNQTISLNMNKWGVDFGYNDQDYKRSCKHN